jgi:hypothetical protein
MGAPNSSPRKVSKPMTGKIYTSVGFKKGYNFILWFIFGGAVVGCKFLANLPLHAS